MSTDEEKNKSEVLLKDAAEKAAVLLKVAADKAAILPLDAAKKAAILLRDAAEKAALLPRDSVEKMTFLLNDATKNAIIILKEEAESVAASKIKFLDIAAHELRNPIASISLLLRVAEKQIEKAETLDADILARLRLPVDRLVRLVVDLLDMSKLERGQLSLVPVKTDMGSLISQCVEDFRMQAPNRNFVIFKPDLPIEMDVDPLRIHQVLANFLDNAVKYSIEGAIDISLAVMPSAVRVSVTDRGPGIPEEKKQSLFTIFSRGNLDSTDHDGGLGLGLSICKGIIDLHNGSIGVESEAGKGSTFYFELPIMNEKV
ncbi:MAG: HAMP domain-containing sensor histidine kinase [Bacteriovorax sp.]